jgi:outer membrane protein OmpA-like peptidoglycan-associated protein
MRRLRAGTWYSTISAGKTLLDGALTLEGKVPFAAALVIWAGAGAAQELSDAELRARFVAQREAIRAATTNPSLGASRGLVLTTVQPSAEAAPGATIEAAPAPAATGTGVLALPGAGAAAGRADPGGLAEPDAEAQPALAHWSLPENQQVNVAVTFAFDSAALSEDQKPKLRQICGAIGDAGVGVLRIVGHTDASGSASYNQQLSVLRAEEVQRFFVNECGLAPDRLQAIGVGEQFPYDERDPFDGVNRRVEFQAIS